MWWYVASSLTFALFGARIVNSYTIATDFVYVDRYVVSVWPPLDVRASNYSFVAT